MSGATIALVVRRTIHAPVERVFAAWTQPEHVRRWWGPKTVICPEVTIDLRVGGGFRIANQFPDGSVVWISGEFELIEALAKLVYTWRLGPQTLPPERVTVKFERQGSATEVIVVHERITSKAARDTHEQGWVGCLDGLQRLLTG